MSEIELYEPLYRVSISIIECGYEEFARLIAERHANETLYSWNEAFMLESGTDGYQFHVCGDEQGGGEKFYVWVAEVDDYNIAHELHHLAHDILFTRGIVYCSQSEEAFAYLTGRLHEMFRPEYQKQREQKREPKAE